MGAGLVEVLLNRVQASDPPQAEIEKILRRPVAFSFPNNYRAMAAAIRSGGPVGAGTDFGRSFASFAATLAGVEPPQLQPSLRDRLRGLLHLASA